MKQILFSLLLTTNSIFACDFSSDVKKENNIYKYTEECHGEVGKIVKENDLNKEQINELEKSIELKDLALKISDKRANLYEEIAEKNTDRLNRLEESRKFSNWLYFASGVAASVLSVFAASKVIRR